MNKIFLLVLLAAQAAYAADDHCHQLEHENSEINLSFIFDHHDQQEIMPLTEDQEKIFDTLFDILLESPPKEKILKIKQLALPLYLRACHKSLVNLAPAFFNLLQNIQKGTVDNSIIPSTCNEHLREQIHQLSQFCENNSLDLISPQQAYIRFTNKIKEGFKTVCSTWLSYHEPLYAEQYIAGVHQGITNCLLMHPRTASDQEESCDPLPQLLFLHILRDMHCEFTPQSSPILLIDQLLGIPTVFKKFFQENRRCSQEELQRIKPAFINYAQKNKAAILQLLKTLQNPLTSAKQLGDALGYTIGFNRTLYAIYSSQIEKPLHRNMLFETLLDPDLHTPLQEANKLYLHMQKNSSFLTADPEDLFNRFINNFSYQYSTAVQEIDRELAAFTQQFIQDSTDIYMHEG